MVPRKKRSELWNYFEKLKPLLVKCTTCKREIKVSDRTCYIKLMRLHLSRHGIFLDNDTYTLPDDLRQCYSELPGYKAKCNNCGETVSFLTNFSSLRRHFRRHCTKIQSQDEYYRQNVYRTVMVPRKKRSKLWNYFEELKPTLVKCTTCKKKIKIPHPTRRTKIMRAHILNVHGISLDDDTLSLPDDLKQYYSKLPGYKAKCNNCGKTLSFLSNIRNLRRHLKRHSTIIQSRDETVMVSKKKRSKLWNYFEELKPTLVKCTTCKKEIKISHPSYRIQTFRAHLLNVHGIFLDNDTLSLPDDLKQYYSKLPGYKAKCNNCGETLSFLTNIAHLRKHLRRHSTRIQSRNKTVMVPSKKRSELWNYFEKLKPLLVKCTTCKREIKVSDRTRYIKLMRLHLSRHGIFLDNDTYTLPDDLRQCYSELPGYKAKCNNCGETVSFLTNFSSLRRHFRRHCTKIQSQDEYYRQNVYRTVMVPRKKRSKLWNYFEELKPTLVKCTTCKKEIKVSHPATKAMRVHLSKHEIFLDNDIRTLPDDLKQYYSKLPGYKAKCNNCGKTLSFLTNITRLRKHLRRHSTKILSQDETVMVSKKKRSKLWNYFEELKPTLVKCTICKKEIKISSLSTRRIKIIRAHLLKKHGISPDDDTLLHDDLKQYYSQLPGYKAKCNNCGKAISFLTNIAPLRRHLKRHSTRIQSRNKNLRRHLKRHSTIIQSRDETVMVPRKKRSKLWNYFEELKPTLVKCTTCKKEIKVFHPKHSTKLMRLHLSKHGIFLDNDTFSLHDDLKQYYSELSGYKAKCNDCGKTMSFLTNITRLRKHLRRHSTRILSRDEPSASSLADDNVGLSARRQGQDTSGLLVQSFIKETTEKSGALNESSTSSSVEYMDPTAKRQSGELSGLPVQSFRETTERTGTLNEPGTSISTDYNTNPTAECQSQETVDLDPQTCEQSRKGTRACDGPSSSSLADNSIDSSADRQSQDASDLPIQALKEAIEKTGALNEPSTFSSTAYIMDLSTGKYIPLHQNQEQVPSSLPVQSFKETAENTGVLDEPSTSSSADYVMDPSAEHQSGEPCGFPVQSFEQMTEGTSALHSDWFYYTIPSDSSSTYYVMAPSAEHQSGEQPGLPVQSFEQMTEGTSALHS
ncbi:uncharacterized protein [Temnothorax longispinosus]